MWWRTRWTTRSRTARGSRSRSRKRPGEVGADRVVPEEVAVGEGRRLADVMDERGEPDERPGRRGRIHGPQRVVPEVLARHLVLRDAPLRGQVGRDAREQARLGEQPQARSTGVRPRAACRARRRSVRPTGGRRVRPGRRSRPASSASTSNSSVAASRTARTIRSASSSNRRAGSPTARRSRAPMSATPSYGSTSPGVAARSARAPHAIALHGEVAAREVELDRVAELDPVRAAEVGVVVVGPERRDLEDIVAVDARPRSRTGSRRRRPGEGLRSASGSAVGREVPVVRARDRGRRRAASRRRHTRRARPPRASRAGRAPTPGSRPRSSSPSVPAVSSVPGTGTSATPRCSRRRGTA